MRRATTYKSFVLRMWQEEEIGAVDVEPQTKIEVESIQSGSKWRFSDLEAFQRFILGEPGLASMADKVPSRDYFARRIDSA